MIFFFYDFPQQKAIGSISSSGIDPSEQTEPSDYNLIIFKKKNQIYKKKAPFISYGRTVSFDILLIVGHVYYSCGCLHFPSQTWLQTL